MYHELISRIFTPGDEDFFRETALEVFRLQASKNPVYRDYLRLLKRNPESVKQLADIPFLPAGFFRTGKVMLEGLRESIIFESSRTTSATPSRHYVADTGLYRKALVSGFMQFYGDPEAYCILVLLPDPAQHKSSSLVFMATELVARSSHPASGFYPLRSGPLTEALTGCEREKQPCLLFGLSSALLELAERSSLKLPHVTVMETGGMKGRREEITREELHEKLQSGLGTSGVHSEYGMTELLSQAYSRKKGIFHCPPWMRALIRDPYDPFTYQDAGMTGGINIIDLANICSCSFIETEDLGSSSPEGGFRVLGRMDHADLRGCNLMVAE